MTVIVPVTTPASLDASAIRTGELVHITGRVSCNRECSTRWCLQRIKRWVNTYCSLSAHQTCHHSHHHGHTPIYWGCIAHYHNGIGRRSNLGRLERETHRWCSFHIIKSEWALDFSVWWTSLAEIPQFSLTSVIARFLADRMTNITALSKWNLKTGQSWIKTLWNSPADGVL